MPNSMNPQMHSNFIENNKQFAMNYFPETRNANSISTESNIIEVSSSEKDSVDKFFAF